MMPRGMAGRSFYATRGRRIATFFSQKLEPLFQAEGMTEQGAEYDGMRRQHFHGLSMNHNEAIDN